MCPSKSSTVTGILNTIDMGNSQKRYCMGNYAFLALNNTSLNVGQTNSVIVEARRNKKHMLMAFSHLLTNNNNASKSTQIFVKVADSSNVEELLLQLRYAVVRNTRFHHQNHLDLVKHLINVYLLKKVCINS